MKIIKKLYLTSFVIEEKTQNNIYMYSYRVPSISVKKGKLSKKELEYAYTII